MTDSNFASLKVIVVDDDPFQISIVKRVLELLGVTQVGEASSGLVAKEALRSRWDVMLLDLNMPDMDGIELVRLLTEYDAPPAVIVFSGEDPRLLETANDLRWSFSVHILGALPKPISWDKLERLLSPFLSELPQDSATDQLIILTE